jgi:hypothetical protein
MFSLDDSSYYALISINDEIIEIEVPIPFQIKEEKRK